MTPQDDLPAGDHPVCPRCGVPAPGETTFCPGCGLNLRLQDGLLSADEYAARERERAWLKQKERARAEADEKATRELASARASEAERARAEAAEREALNRQPAARTEGGEVAQPQRPFGKRRSTWIAGAVLVVLAAGGVAAMALAGSDSPKRKAMLTATVDAPATAQAEAIPPVTTEAATTRGAFSNSSYPERVQQLVRGWAGGKDFPAQCLEFGFSSLDPGWAFVGPKSPTTSFCEGYAFNGVAYMHRVGDRWRTVLNGSDLQGYCTTDIPRRILQSLPHDVCMAPEAAAGMSFLSPTGNIHCMRTTGRSVTCGTLSNGRAVTMGAYKAPVRTPLSPALRHAKGHVLAYGKTWTSGPVFCKSAFGGVTCTSGVEKFTINSEGVELGDQGVQPT